ncbi:hypothetical protein LTR56_018131 [Elasticomyces elasticus]|nr:hypothetical protein LTR56_018131 [Elasticomyces elasticus]KAK4912843.1 hypothetical protein LTR49_018805 [Elasticomyces elasticus]
MNAVVLLDQGGNVSYTNLDEITGKVVVRCTKSSDVSSIAVKLEGESRTRLMSPSGPNGERPRPQLEYHKILYKVQTVFPPPDILEVKGSKASYTLPPGQHEYPFRFKVPFNNSCSNDRSQLAGGISITGSGLEVRQPPQRHVHKTLPPTLSGFPGEAEIRYYVKATVQRNSWYKENTRTETPFTFLPLEPPRRPITGSEVYARQNHAFTSFEDGEPVRLKMKGIFGRKREPAPVPGRSEPPVISIDARLPEPALLTCNQEIPLRIVVKKLSDSTDPIYLQSLQIALVGLTKIRAHLVHRTEANSSILVSKSNMGIVVGSPNDPSGTEVAIDDRIWRGQPLPNTVAPSFEACNISRTYQLDIRVGLSYSGPTAHSLKVRKTDIPRVVVALPMRLDLDILSGIKPSEALLEAVARGRGTAGRVPPGKSAPIVDKLRTEGRMPNSGAGQAMPTSIDEAGPSRPPEPPAEAASDVLPPSYSEAPPSYEDAIATDLPPIDAPRPNYAPPAAVDDDLLGRDEKRG